MILRKLKTSDEKSFKQAMADFQKNDPNWQFAFHFDERKPFSEYVSLVELWERGEQLNGFVPNTFLVAVVDEKIVGRVSLRHELNDFLMWEEGGHIGYGVVPSYRRQGYALQMLKQSLKFARDIGLSRVLLTTDDWNTGSIKVIQRNGGVKETSRDVRVKTNKLRFWIDLT